MAHSIIGSGVYNLDTVVVREYPEGPQRQRVFTERTVLEESGGTCGNVVTMLSHLGWRSFPEVTLDMSAEGARLRDDLGRWGCDLRFARCLPEGGTTLLRCVHKRDPEGRHVTAFRATSPGSRFPKRHFLRLRDEVPQFLESLDFTPDVYFFDDSAAGNRAVAAAMRERGALVWHEPDRLEGKAGEACVSVSDIVKFSSENIPDVSFTDAWKDRLFIQTMGGDGIRFRLRGGDWVTVPAVPNPDVVDWEGAGDWTTSAFLDALGRRGLLRMDALTEENVRECLAEAQSLASASVSYMGSKGMIHAGKI